MDVLKKLYPNKYKAILDSSLYGSHRSKNIALTNAARTFTMRINLEEPVKIEDGSLRYFAQNPIKSKIGNKGLRVNSPQWIINVKSKKAVLLASIKMAEFSPYLSIENINDGRVRIKNTGQINNYGNMFFSPDIFESIITRVKGTDLDSINLSTEELNKFKNIAPNLRCET